MVFEARKQSEKTKHGLRVTLERSALSMEDKMADVALGRARNYG